MWNPYALLVGMKDGAATVEIHLMSPQQVKHASTI